MKKINVKTTARATNAAVVQERSRAPPRCCEWDMLGMPITMSVLYAQPHSNHIRDTNETVLGDIILYVFRGQGVGPVVN